MYSQGATDENYLRGVQEADGNGDVKFTSIFPAAYSGRWPHIHFEVYPSLAEATNAGTQIATSQLALPAGRRATPCTRPTATAERAQPGRRRRSPRDMVFRDGWSQQLATVTGSVDNGYTALNVPV